MPVDCSIISHILRKWVFLKCPYVLWSPCHPFPSLRFSPFDPHLSSSKAAHFLIHSQKRKGVLQATVTMSQSVENQRKPIKTHSTSGVSPIALPQTRSCATSVPTDILSTYLYRCQSWKAPELLPSWRKSLTNSFCSAHTYFLNKGGHVISALWGRRRQIVSVLHHLPLHLPFSYSLSVSFSSTPPFSLTLSYPTSCSPSSLRLLIPWPHPFLPLRVFTHKRLPVS